MGLKRHHALAVGQHDAPERHQRLAAHRLADDRKGVLPDRLVGGDVIGGVEEATGFASRLVDEETREPIDLR